MNKTFKQQKPLGWKAMAAYGAGDLGLNFYWQGVGFFLLYFYTDIVGLPNTTAGIVYAIGGFVDAFSDPIMGLTADRTRSRWGRYRPYLLFGLGPLGISFILLFTLPSLVPAIWTVFVCIATHIVFRLCYTVVSIPYGALGARLTFNARERTSLAGVRMMAGAIGGVIIVSIVSQFRHMMSDESAFIWISVFAAIIGAFLVFLSFIGSRERRLNSHEHELPIARNYSATTIFKATLRNTPFLIIVSSLFLLTMANMIVVKTILYRFEHILNAPELGGLAIILMAAIPLFTIPIWVRIYHWLDKRGGFVLGCLVTSLSLLLLYFFGDWSPELTIAAYVGIAAGFSAFAVGVWSIIPDTIDYGHWQSGSRVESGLVGLASAVQKTAIALAGLWVGVALDAFGYQAGYVQTEETVTALHYFSSSTPIVLMIATAALFYFYPISSSRHAEIVSEISES